jgi:hypothetical protein
MWIKQNLITIFLPQPTRICSTLVVFKDGWMGDGLAKNVYLNTLFKIAHFPGKITKDQKDNKFGSREVLVVLLWSCCAGAWWLVLSSGFLDCSLAY